jgi:hypothetical protein
MISRLQENRLKGRDEIYPDISPLYPLLMVE